MTFAAYVAIYDEIIKAQRQAIQQLLNEVMAKARVDYYRYHYSLQGYRDRTAWEARHCILTAHAHASANFSEDKS